MVDVTLRKQIATLQAERDELQRFYNAVTTYANDGYIIDRHDIERFKRQAKGTTDASRR